MKNPPSEVKHSDLSKYARRFFSGTLLSRISGMARDMSMAAVFGDHPSVAAFMVAFRFAHFLRRLLGEGALQSILIPHYEALRLQDERRASAFFFKLTLRLLLLLCLIVLVVEAVLPNIFQSEVGSLFAILFPSLIFISLYGLNLSLLQCKNSFFSSSVAPFACNAIWLGAIFLSAHQEPSLAMKSLALGTVIGLIVQWLITLPQTAPSLIEGWRHRALTPPLLHLGKAASLGLLGTAAVQINSFLDMLFARAADIQGPVYLWYALRLEQLPLALIGLACVYSVTPSLTRLIKAEDSSAAKDLFLFGHDRIFLLVIPATWALFALGFPSVNLLFGHGHFSPAAVAETALCLSAYGLSLLPATLSVYYASLFYAHGNFKLPTLASLLSVATNLLLNSLFVFALHWGAVSIALSTSLSALLNAWLLRRALPQPLAPLSWFGPLWATGAFAWSGSMLLDTLWFGLLTAPRDTADQLLHLGASGALFCALFALGLRLTSPHLLGKMKDLVIAR